MMISLDVLGLNGALENDVINGLLKAVIDVNFIMGVNT